MTTTIQPPTYTAESAAELYVGAKMGSGAPVSTAAAVRALRTLLTDCELTDHELATVVAQAAVDAGLDVSFDGSAEDQGFPSFRAPAASASRSTR